MKSAAAASRSSNSYASCPEITLGIHFSSSFRCHLLFSFKLITYFLNFSTEFNLFAAGSKITSNNISLRNGRWIPASAKFQTGSNYGWNQILPPIRANRQEDLNFFEEILLMQKGDFSVISCQLMLQFRLLLDAFGTLCYHTFKVQFCNMLHTEDFTFTSFSSLRQKICTLQLNNYSLKNVTIFLIVIKYMFYQCLIKYLK